MRTANPSPRTDPCQPLEPRRLLAAGPTGAELAAASVALAADRTLHALYVDAGGRLVHQQRPDGGGAGDWSDAVGLDDTGRADRAHHDLALDADGDPVAAWRRTAGDGELVGVHLALRDAPDDRVADEGWRDLAGGWDARRMSRGGGVGLYPDVLVAPSGEVHLASFRKQIGGLSLASVAGDGVIRAVALTDPNTAIGRLPDLAADATDGSVWVGHAAETGPRLAVRGEGDGEDDWAQLPAPADADATVKSLATALIDGDAVIAWSSPNGVRSDAYDRGVGKWNPRDAADDAGPAEVVGVVAFTRGDELLAGEPGGTPALLATGVAGRPVAFGPGGEAAVVTDGAVLVAPPAPTDVSADATPGGISVAWQNPGDLPDGTPLQVERSRDGGATFTTVSTVTSPASAYLDLSAEGGRFRYRVRAADSADGATVRSRPQDAPPAADVPARVPTGVTATLGDFDAATVTWSDESANEAGYRVRRSLDGGPFMDLGDVPADGESFVDQGLPPAATAEYAVAALTDYDGGAGPGESAAGGLVRTPARLRVEFEDFNPGGQGVGYNDTTPADQGGDGRPGEGVDVRTEDPGLAGVDPYTRLLFVREGEWLRYTLDVPADWTYRVDVRAGLFDPNVEGAMLDLDVDGVTVIDDAAVRNVAGVGQVTFGIGEIALAAGTRTLEFRFDGSPLGKFGDYDFFDLVPVRTGRTEITADATPFASGTAAGRPVAAAVDGDPFTYWRADTTQDAWLALDFGQERQIASVETRFASDHGQDFRLQTSDDGTTWQDARLFTNRLGDLHLIEDLGLTTRYLRLFVDVGRPAGKVITLQEVRVLAW